MSKNPVISADIPANYIFTFQNDKFLLHDTSYSDKNRILIFGTNENPSNLKNSKIIHANGTFKIFLPEFNQVYIIFCGIRNDVFPCLYFYLTNKNKTRTLIFQTY